MIKKLSITVLLKTSLFLVMNVSILSTIGCSDHGNLSESFKVENKDAQNHLIEALEKKNIPVKVDSENRVWFSSTHSDDVHAIADKVMSESTPDRVSFHYADPKYTDMLIQKLQAHNVPFEIKVSGNNKQIVLDQKNVQKWSKIKAQVDELHTQEVRGSLTK